MPIGGRVHLNGGSKPRTNIGGVGGPFGKLTAAQDGAHIQGFEYGEVGSSLGGLHLPKKSFHVFVGLRAGVIYARQSTASDIPA
jgi:hypothetical protein